MNPFKAKFLSALTQAGFTPVKRGNDTYWRKANEKGVLYDIAEATVQLLSLTNKK